MKGDFSRIRFNPKKNYTAVLQQQGRVALDADGNEGAAIDQWLRTTTNTDVIGPYGGPIDDAGFEIAVKGKHLEIGAGRYYIQGLLVENATTISYDAQPFLAHSSPSSESILVEVDRGRGAVAAQFALQVWQRLVTQLDDECLSEPALNSADTTARLQTVWRVVAKLSRLSVKGTIEEELGSGGTEHIVLGGVEHAVEKRRQSATSRSKQAAATHQDKASLEIPAGTKPHTIEQSGTSGAKTCCDFTPLELARSGSMTASTGSSGSQCGCQPIPSAGYHGLENQLYRVEIHTGGALEAARFKWSRENASVLAAVTAINGTIVTTSGLGPDMNLGFQPGQWVELTDDTNVFGSVPNSPGKLYKIASLGPGPLQVTLETAVTGVNSSRNARMRRWDQSGSTATSSGVPLSTSSIQLENGIEIAFKKGMYQPGDYWIVTARTSTGTIDWPPCDSDGAEFQPAQFTPMYQAPLACIHWKRNRMHQYGDQEQQGLFEMEDCRKLFSPLTALAPDVVPDALHVTNTSWTNDDVMTIDTLIAKGLSLTLDRAATSPWSGGNFRVTLETAVRGSNQYEEVEFYNAFQSFLRTEYVLESPLGITTSGKQVFWLTAPSGNSSSSRAAAYLYHLLNSLLYARGSAGHARVRVRLFGNAIFSSTQKGSIYLDGVSFSEKGTRSGDKEDRIALKFPGGNAHKASDFESWFYLAPSVLITNASIELRNNTNALNGTTVVVDVDWTGAMKGLHVGSGAAAAEVTMINALIELNYSPTSQVDILLQLSDTTVATVPSTFTVQPGDDLATVPITVHGSPGPGKTVTLTLTASISGALGSQTASDHPTLTITGGQVPQEPLR